MSEDAGWILTPEAAAAGDRAGIGGKARGLLAIADAGLSVPPWRVIPASAASGRPWAGSEAAGCRALWEALARGSGLAVRSSARDEDARLASRAGQYATVFVSEPETLPEALDTVLASASAPGSMAVIVQQAVASSLAGVIFSASPEAAHPDWMYVEAVRGQGAALVDGALTPARIRLHAASARQESLAPSSGGLALLPESAAESLRAGMLAVEAVLACAADSEWALDDDGRLWWLQARPATVLHPEPAQIPPYCATSWFFDQRFSEPIRPLTRSTIIETVAEVGIREALAMRGCPAPEPLLHDYAGQVYAAHDAFHMAFGAAPRWLLTPDLRQLFPGQCHCADPPPREPFRHVRTSLRAMWRHRGEALDNLRAWRRFMEALPGRLAAVPAASPEDWEDWQAAWGRLEELTRAFLRIHRWSLLWADYGYRIYRAILWPLPSGAARRLEEKLRRELDLPTVRANACLREALERPGDSAARDRLVSGHGHRSPSLDLAEPVWEEMLADGTLFTRYAGLVGAHVGGGVDHVEARGLLSMLMHPLRRALEMREEQRHAWERILARQRALVLRLAEHLETRGVLASREDVWLLHWDELAAAARGAIPDAGLLHARARAWRLQRQMPRPAFIGPPRETPGAANEALTGLGASPGKARGRAMVCRGAPALDTPIGPVVLVLVSLDPAWTPLLRNVAGVVLERGGLLSHAALIAREYRTPLVTGVRDAVSRIPDGAWVEIDGRAGTVLRVAGPDQ